MSRIHDAELLDANGNSIVPRTLLQTITLSGAQNTVELTLPASPWKRFEIQIDDMAAVQDRVGGLIKFRINGAIREGAADYAFHVSNQPANAGRSQDHDDSFPHIQLTRDNDATQFGNQNNEAFSFSLQVVPGVDATALPMLWWQGMGICDTSLGMGYHGHGMYRGVTTQEFGRIEGIEFSMDADNIKRGEFRLYGTE
jgi:hypothetical protein